VKQQVVGIVEEGFEDRRGKKTRKKIRAEEKH